MVNREALKNRKWTQFLRSIPTGEPMSFDLETTKDMDTIITIASRMNTHSTWKYLFSIQADFLLKRLTITATVR